MTRLGLLCRGAGVEHTEFVRRAGTLPELSAAVVDFVRVRNRRPRWIILAYADYERLDHRLITAYRHDQIVRGARRGPPLTYMGIPLQYGPRFYMGVGT